MNIGHQLGTQLRDSVRKPESRLVAHELGQWAVRWVREVIEEMDPIFFEQWHTQDDERTCPICGQLDGVVSEAGKGFAPPVHDFCRCERRYHHTEFRKRTIEVWRQEQYFASNIQWRRTP